MRYCNGLYGISALSLYCLALKYVYESTVERKYGPRC